MQWVERAPMHGPAFVLPRSGGQPVFVDPDGHRARRLQHAARVVAGAAAVYLAMLALGLAGPATPPFSLFPGAGAKAGEGGTEAVHTGSGVASAEQVRDAVAAVGAVLRGATPATAAGVPGADPAAPTAAPDTTPATGRTPGASTPGAAPGAAPTAVPSGHAPGAPGATPGPSGHSRPPSGSGSAPPAGSAPGSTPSATPSHGPPPSHIPPGQAKKPDGAPGNGNGNGPPANHGQEMASQHSHSPNH